MLLLQLYFTYKVQIFNCLHIIASVKKTAKERLVPNKQVSAVFRDTAYLSVSHQVSGSSHSRPLFEL